MGCHYQKDCHYLDSYGNWPEIFFCKQLGLNSSKIQKLCQYFCFFQKSNGQKIKKSSWIFFMNLSIPENSLSCSWLLNVNFELLLLSSSLLFRHNHALLHINGPSFPFSPLVFCVHRQRNLEKELPNLSNKCMAAPIAFIQDFVRSSFRILLLHIAMST